MISVGFVQVWVASVVLTLAQPALAFPDHLRVRLFESHQPISRIYVNAPFVLSGSRQAFRHGSYCFTATNHGVFLSCAADAHLNLNAARFTLVSEDRGVAVGYANGRERHYLGLINIESASPSESGSAGVSPASDHSLSIVNEVDARHYVESVVGSETLPAFPAEMLKAQAVLTATKIFLAPAYATISDSTQDQAYLGADYVRPSVKAAVAAVWGQFLYYKKDPVQVYFHSTCGGKTSSAISVFGDAARNMPYLKCVPCDFCRQSPFYKTTKSSVPTLLFHSTFGDLPQVNKYDCAQRPELLTLRKNGKQSDMSGYQFWIAVGQKFGWDKLPGTRFKLSATDRLVKLESTGAGHGVGLCQWGAAGMARQGKSYQEILQYYYPGTTVAAHHI